MRILKFGERNIKLSFEEPETIELLEATVHKSLVNIIGIVPRISEIAAMLVCGSEVMDKKEAYELFKVYEGGVYAVAGQINEELRETGWLGIVDTQAKDENGKN